MNRSRIKKIDLDSDVRIKCEDFEKLKDYIDRLASLTDLQEVHWCKDILFHTLMANYKRDIQMALNGTAKWI